MIDRVADQVVALSVGNLGDLRSAAKSLRTIDLAPQLEYAGRAYALRLVAREDTGTVSYNCRAFPSGALH